VDLEIVVVDNPTTDGTIRQLATHHPEVRRISLDENRGFAAANNVGVSSAAGRFVFLLNNDTVLEPGALAALLDAGERHPEFAIFAPQMLRMRDPAVVDNRGIYLDRSGHLRQLDAGAPADPGRPSSEIFGASGGAMLLRREVVERCGLFDESLGSYLEDGDFACRARVAGFRTLYVPGARVLHEGSATGDRIPERKLHLIQRNMLIVHRRWLPFRPWRLHNWLGLAYEGAQCVRSAARRQGAVTWRAKREALAVGSRSAPPTADGNRRLRRWLGVRGRAPVACRGGPPPRATSGRAG
jgi:GT2 family glycosyltransferase